jgi:hypothetical protein
MSKVSFERAYRGIMVAIMIVATVAFSRGALDTDQASAQTADSFYREAVIAEDLVITVDAQSAASEGAVLTCTEDSGTASLDVALQRTLDSGANWADVATFTQLTATGGQTVFYADVQAASAQMIGDTLRADYDVTGTGQYTCDLTIAGTSG